MRSGGRQAGGVRLLSTANDLVSGRLDSAGDLFSHGCAQEERATALDGLALVRGPKS
jgi:hypothetical protein